MAQRGGAGGGARRRKPSSGQRASAPTRRRRQKARETYAIKSMAIGGLIIALLCVFFFVRIGGKTLFNHLFEPEPEVVAPGTSTTPGASGTTAPRIPSSPATGSAIRPAVPTRPVGLEASPKAGTATPMEKITPSEQDSLDDLIEAKSKK